MRLVLIVGSWEPREGRDSPGSPSKRSGALTPSQPQPGPQARSLDGAFFADLVPVPFHLLLSGSHI